jgi:hypothetical protein
VPDLPSRCSGTYPVNIVMNSVWGNRSRGYTWLRVLWGTQVNTTSNPSSSIPCLNVSVRSYSSCTDISFTPRYVPRASLTSELT